MGGARISPGVTGYLTAIRVVSVLAALASVLVIVCAVCNFMFANHFGSESTAKLMPGVWVGAVMFITAIVGVVTTMLKVNYPEGNMKIMLIVFLVGNALSCILAVVCIGLSALSLIGDYLLQIIDWDGSGTECLQDDILFPLGAAMALSSVFLGIVIGVVALTLLVLASLVVHKLRTVGV